MKFATEEISLCKQVAEKHRKEIKYGDWFEFKGNILLQKDMHEPKMSDKCIPLWTISDCLEFLRENPRIQIVEIVWDITKFKANVSIRPCGTHHGKTPLEACLKAVLAVLEEKEEEVQCPACCRWISIKADGCVCELEEGKS